MIQVHKNMFDRTLAIQPLSIDLLGFENEKQQERIFKKILHLITEEQS